MDRQEQTKSKKKLSKGQILGAVGIVLVAIAVFMFQIGASHKKSKPPEHEEGNSDEAQAELAHSEEAETEAEGEESDEVAHQDHETQEAPAKTHEASHGAAHDIHHDASQESAHQTNKSHEVSHHAVQGAPHGVWQTYAAAWESIQDKASEIQGSMQENERLRYENAHLRLKLETAQFSCREKEASEKTKKIGEKIAEETGSRVARTLASIAYKVPGELLPNQLYTLGITYFKAHEDEKAAVILSFLTSMDENTAYQTPRNFLMAGVSWYRVENFEMADVYFDQVLKQPENPQALQFQAQARLWKGLVAKRIGKETETQYWLKDLVDHHPHSAESEWVNGAPASEKEREPASSSEE